jgi:hypothetical protein
MVNARITTKVGWTSPVVNTSRSFYIDTETRFPYIRQMSHSETDAQVTESPAFTIRHLVWSFSCSHPAADAIESPSHSAPVLGIAFVGSPEYWSLLRKAASRQ